VGKFHNNWTHHWDITKPDGSILHMTASIPNYSLGNSSLDIDITDMLGCSERFFKTGICYGCNSPEDLVKYVESLDLPHTTCKHCDMVMLDRVSDHRPKNECDSCYVKLLLKQFEKEEEELKKQDDIQDSIQYSKGMRFKTIAWVHGRGDDFSIELYSKVKPTQVEITKILTKEGSSRFDDYSIVVLNP